MGHCLLLRNPEINLRAIPPLDNEPLTGFWNLLRSLTSPEDSHNDEHHEAYYATTNGSDS